MYFVYWLEIVLIVLLNVKIEIILKCLIIKEVLEVVEDLFLI